MKIRYPRLMAQTGRLADAIIIIKMRKWLAERTANLVNGSQMIKVASILARIKLLS